MVVRSVKIWEAIVYLVNHYYYVLPYLIIHKKIICKTVFIPIIHTVAYTNTENYVSSIMSHHVVHEYFNTNKMH